MAFTSANATSCAAMACPLKIAANSSSTCCFTSPSDAPGVPRMSHVLFGLNIVSLVSILYCAIPNTLVKSKRVFPNNLLVVVYWQVAAMHIWFCIVPLIWGNSSYTEFYMSTDADGTSTEISAAYYGMSGTGCAVSTIVIYASMSCMGCNCALLAANMLARLLTNRRTCASLIARGFSQKERSNVTLALLSETRHRSLRVQCHERAANAKSSALAAPQRRFLNLVAPFARRHASIIKGKKMKQLAKSRQTLQTVYSVFATLVPTFLTMATGRSVVYSVYCSAGFPLWSRLFFYVGLQGHCLVGTAYMFPVIRHLFKGARARLACAACFLPSDY